MSYRAKDLKTGQWFRGTLLRDEELSYILLASRGKKVNVSLLDYITVDSKTVCKCSGMVYNNHEICENDIYLESLHKDKGQCLVFFKVKFGEYTCRVSVGEQNIERSSHLGWYLEAFSMYKDGEECVDSMKFNDSIPSEYRTCSVPMFFNYNHTDRDIIFLGSVYDLTDLQQATTLGRAAVEQGRRDKRNKDESTKINLNDIINTNGYKVLYSGSDNYIKDLVMGLFINDK